MIDFIKNETWKRCIKCGCITNDAGDTCHCGGKLVIDPSANPYNPELSAKWDRLAKMTAAIDEAKETIVNLPPTGELTDSEKGVRSCLLKRLAKLKENHEKLLDEIRSFKE